MPLNRYFKLYLNAGRSIPLVINASQNDSGEQWYFSLFTETGEQYYPSAGAIVGIKCDGKLIDNEATVDSRGYVIVTETAQMTAVPGKNTFELQIDSHTHGTANFIVLVEPSPTNGGVLSDSDLSLFQQAINSIAIAGSGAPAVATTASEMTDTGKIYLYAGSETGYTAGDWYYYNGSAWTDGGKYGGTVDATLTIPGAAADAKKVGDELSDLKSEIAQFEAIPYAVKVAMENMFTHALYKDYDPSNDYSTFHAWVNTLTVLSISAVYTQGTVRIGDSLDDLKPYLVVTANYDNGTSAVVSGYTLNGSLNLGTNIITVTYGEKTTTFEVTVSYRYSWKLSDGVLHVEHRGITGNDGDVPALWYLPNANLKTRRAILATVQSDGQMPQFSNSDLTEKEPSGYYAIPIPVDATSVTFGSTPTAYYMAYTFYNMQNGDLVRTTGSSFESDNPKTVTFSAGQYEYMSVLCKYGSAGSNITDANELTEFTFTFS